MAEIRFQEVRKSFGDFAAVDGVDLEVKDGSSWCCSVPAGCGKTTLLRCLAGLERVTAGACTSEIAMRPISHPEDGGSRWCSRATPSFRT